MVIVPFSLVAGLFVTSALVSHAKKLNHCDEGSVVIEGRQYCQPIERAVISRVGHSGSYPRVIGIRTDRGNQHCDTVDVAFAGPLAPFNEELSMHFRGPIDLRQFAVFYPQRSSAKPKRSGMRHSLEPWDQSLDYYAGTKPGLEKRALVYQTVTTIVTVTQVTDAVVAPTVIVQNSQDKIGATLRLPKNVSSKIRGDHPHSAVYHMSSNIYSSDGIIIGVPDVENAAPRPENQATSVQSSKGRSRTPENDVPAVSPHHAQSISIGHLDGSNRPQSSSSSSSLSDPAPTTFEDQPDDIPSPPTEAEGEEDKSGGRERWIRNAYFNSQHSTASGVTFLNNMGGGASGVFDYVFGNSLSYADAYAKSAPVDPKYSTDDYEPIAK